MTNSYTFYIWDGQGLELQPDWLAHSQSLHWFIIQPSVVVLYSLKQSCVESVVFPF